MLRKMTKATTRCRFEVRADIQNASNSIRKGAKSSSKALGSTRVANRRKKRPVAKISMKSEILEGKILLDLPIQTVSEANCFEPWRVKHGRHKEQQRIVALALNPLKGNVRLPCRLVLTRFAPDSLDKFDNLPMSFKYIVDAVCAIITGEYRAGKADGDPRISISCNQVKSDAYGIRIELIY